jgi:hypothetical protein
MASKGETKPARTEFVSPYGWLLAPGDHMQADYTSPTCVNNWLEANPLEFATSEKEKAYGQWIAQLLQNQLAIPLVPLYRKKDQTAWPFTLRPDVIEEFGKYFERYTKRSKESQ